MQVRFKAALAATALFTAVISAGEAQASTNLSGFPAGSYYENYSFTSSIAIPALITANVYPPDSTGFQSEGFTADSLFSVTPPGATITDPFLKKGAIAGTMFIGHDFDSDSGEHLVLGLNPIFGATVTGASFDGAFGSYNESGVLSDLDALFASNATEAQELDLFGFIGQVYSENGTFAANGGAIDVVNFSNGAQVGTGAAFLTPVLAPVPEPAIWAMLLLGFGAIGWTLRSRRTLTAA